MSSTTNHAYSSLKIGDGDQLSHIVTEADVRLFAASSGDNNPVHLDHEYAERSRFGGVIAHGMYSGILISRMLGTQFPGPGTIYLSQSLNFKAPVRPGDTLNVKVEVKTLHESKPVATLACLVTNQNDELVTDGEAVVLVPKEAKEVEMPPLPRLEEV